MPRRAHSTRRIEAVKVEVMTGVQTAGSIGVITNHEGGRVDYEGERVNYVSGSLASGGSLASERERIARTRVRYRLSMIYRRWRKPPVSVPSLT